MSSYTSMVPSHLEGDSLSALGVDISVDKSSAGRERGKNGAIFEPSCL